jgi:hypothetical protein
MEFSEVFLGGADVVPLNDGISLHVMVGGGHGVAVPKELMGLVVVVTDGRTY